MKVVGAVIALAIVGVVGMSLPDIKRYIDMRKM